VYIEFTAASVESVPGFIASHLLTMLEAEIKAWARVNEIEYTDKRYKNTYRVAFNDDKHYTVFRLTWADLPYIEYRLIDNKW
jgi:hypothetical protein